MLLALNSLLFDSTLKIDIIVDVTGSDITTANGNVSVSTDTNADVTGSDITTANGDVSVSSSIIVDVTGESITSYIGNVDAFKKYKIDNFIKTEKSKNVFAIQEKELDFIVQNAQILNLMPSEKTLSLI